MKKGKIISNLAACFFVVVNFVSCVKSDTREAPVTDPCSGTAGPLFTEVKSLIATKCVGCHNNTTANGGMNWAIECNIVINKTRIYTRVVVEGTMPPFGPLSVTDKAKITNWINAGGKYTD